jgi:hypothetical protein
MRSPDDGENDLRELKVKRRRKRQITDKNGDLLERRPRFLMELNGWPFCFSMVQVT